MLNFYYLPDYVAAFTFEFSCTYKATLQYLLMLSCEILKQIEENQNVDCATFNSPPLLGSPLVFSVVDIVLIKVPADVLGAMVVVVFCPSTKLADLEKHTCENEYNRNHDWTALPKQKCFGR